jgi:chromosome segregation ATPase
VANADDYKGLYDSERTAASTARANERKAVDDLNAKIKEADDLKTELEGKIGDLGIQINDLQTQLANAQRERDAAIQGQNNATAAYRSAQQTNEQQRGMMNNAQTALKEAESELTKVESDLKETNRVLLEKMSIIAQQEERIQQLVDEKTELQAKLDKFLRNYGQVAVTAPPKIEPRDEKVKPVVPVTTIGLKGLVTKVDAKNELAQISIGSADGVKENMKFYVTRGDSVICDILILDVDTEKAVGILDRVRQQPKSGDSVSTNL